mmetsp:Transcript_43103/g.71759  ORF Transcript_43103/g.71759 Transcript_43103/m.71759 type:complete len:372 (-) Transcript_43103:473-1588(-)
MAQLIHAFVPNARLCFATAFISATSFASNILALASKSGPCGGADVIVDDVGYFAELYFEDSLLSAVIDVVADMGVLYFSAAGNDNGRFIESDIHPVNSSDTRIPEVLRNRTSYIWWNAFNIPEAPSPFLLPIRPRRSFEPIWMQWNDQSGHVLYDLDMFILNANFTVVTFSLAASRSNGNPYENVNLRAGTYYVAVGAFNTSPAGPLPRPYKLVVYDIGSPIPYGATERSTWGHSTANGALSVAAYNYTSLSLEPYSSHGPATIYFGIGGLFPKPQARLKPDIAAIDCTDTSFFGGFDFEQNGLLNFCGTSAAASHAAAVPAFLQQLSNKRLNVYTLRNLFSTQSESTAWDPATGYGLINTLKVAKHMGNC